MHPEAWFANKDYLAWLSSVGWIDGYTPGCDDYTFTTEYSIGVMYEAWKAGYHHRKSKAFAYSMAHPPPDCEFCGGWGPNETQQGSL